MRADVRSPRRSSGAPAGCLSVALGRRPEVLRTGSLSPSRCSACCPLWPRSSRCSVSSTTRNGWTTLRIRSSASSRDGCWRSRWRSCSRFESRRAGRVRGPARVAARRAGGGGSPCAAGERRAGPLDERSATGSSPRPAAIRSLCSSCRGASARRSWPGGFELARAQASTWSYRGPLPAARRGVARDVAAADAAGGGGSVGDARFSGARPRGWGSRRAQ